MAVSSVGSSTSSPFSFSSGGAKSFLNSTDISPVQRMLQAQKAKENTKTSYFDSEDYLRMKAFEIRRRITMYQSLGLQQEYQLAQQEGAEVVKKYQALLAKSLKKSTTSTSA